MSRCDLCGGSFGDAYYEFDETLVCDECIKDYVKSHERIIDYQGIEDDILISMHEAQVEALRERYGY